MSHLENPYNEPFVYNKDEARRLRSTLIATYFLSGLIALAAVTAGLFALVTMSAMSLVVLLGAVVALVVTAMMVRSNRPRYLRLVEMERSPGELVAAISLVSESLAPGSVVTYGSRDNGLFEAIKLNESGTSWDIKSFTSPMDGETRLAFHGILTSTTLEDPSTQQPFGYNSHLVAMLDDAKQLIKASSEFSGLATDFVLNQRKDEAELLAKSRASGSGAEM